MFDARRLLIVPALLATVALAACGTSAAPAAPATPVTHNLTGTITLTQDLSSIFGISNVDKAPKAGGPCGGFGGYDDIKEGAPVVVKDQSSTILATGALTAGTEMGGYPFGSCEFTFNVPALPDKPFYQVEVSHRGNVTYSKAKLVSAGWRVDLTLGK